MGKGGRGRGGPGVRGANEPFVAWAAKLGRLIFISPQLLEWKGIEATESLSKSANTKIVVIGNSKNGLPLILGQ